MKRIEGRARTVRELLDSTKYTVDFYQREYAWQERQVRELLDDLTGKFLDFYDASHARDAVEQYGHYFLGSIVISHKRGQRFIVDGQQRLTTLTLLLIYLYHLQDGREAQVDLKNLIYSEKFGRRSFNLDIADRIDVMQDLLNGAVPRSEGQSESIQNIAARYANLTDYFPEEIQGEALPYFIDWLLENVHLVEIEAYSDEDAYTIFETMNDRGLSLSLPEMLKGYVLANIAREEDQRAVNDIWKAHMHELKAFGADDDADFFKTWLRARYAETIRSGHKGEENKDFERIGSEFHRLVRDKRQRIGLTDSNSFVRFVKNDLDFYSQQMRAIWSASHEITKGWESIYYNEDRGFTLQTQALLAPLTPDDDHKDTRQKIRLVADFIDIWLARRVWNFRTISYSSVKYTIFTLTKEIRHRDVAGLSEFLRAQLDEQPETFANQPRTRLHQQNYRQIRHILARLTHWVDVQCGLPSHFQDLVSRGTGSARPFEIEHLWAADFERFAENFEDRADFDAHRNRLGGLLLLQRGLNQSLGDASYERKREAYISKGESLLARSLHPEAYTNNPAFRRLIDTTGLPFRPYESFGRAELAERQELYIRLAEWIWNPSRLDLDGEKPPVHQPIVDPDDEDNGGTTAIASQTRHESRYRFWEQLLAASRARHDLHQTISPSRYNWVGARRHGQWWNYMVAQNETRAVLYLDGPDAEQNKALFDALYAERGAVERAFGGPLEWNRLNDKRACHIRVVVHGGWADESTWPRAIEEVVDAMVRLYDALAERVEALKGR